MQGAAPSRGVEEGETEGQEEARAGEGDAMRGFDEEGSEEACQAPTRDPGAPAKAEYERAAHALAYDVPRMVPTDHYCERTHSQHRRAKEEGRAGFPVVAMDSATTHRLAHLCCA